MCTDTRNIFHAGSDTEKTLTVAIVLGLMLLLTTGILVASLIYSCALKCSEKQNTEHSYVNQNVSHIVSPNGPPPPSCNTLDTCPASEMNEVPETNEVHKNEAEYEEIPDYFKGLNQEKQNSYEPYSKVGHT